ncbi:hypothetical protein BJX62DRAFT_69068 [Aspergillus germanicus]
MVFPQRGWTHSLGVCASLLIPASLSAKTDYSLDNQLTFFLHLRIVRLCSGCLCFLERRLAMCTIPSKMHADQLSGTTGGISTASLYLPHSHGVQSSIQPGLLISFRAEKEEKKKTRSMNEVFLRRCACLLQASGCRPSESLVHVAPSPFSRPYTGGKETGEHGS